MQIQLQITKHLIWIPKRQINIIKLINESCLKPDWYENSKSLEAVGCTKVMRVLKLFKRGKITVTHRVLQWLTALLRVVVDSAWAILLYWDTNSAFETFDQSVGLGGKAHECLYCSVLLSRVGRLYGMNRVIVKGIIQPFSGLKCAYFLVYSLGFKTAVFSVGLQPLQSWEFYWKFNDRKTTLATPWKSFKTL